MIFISFLSAPPSPTHKQQHRGSHMPLSARQLIAGVAAGDTEAVRELVTRVIALEEAAKRVEQLEAQLAEAHPELGRRYIGGSNSAQEPVAGVEVTDHASSMEGSLDAPLPATEGSGATVADA